MYLSSVTAALFAVFALLYPLTSQAATLQIDGAGQLLGADGVDVGGVLYDVDFVDGTCAALLNGCDEVSDFTFTTEATALEAANALQAQVFISGNDFDVTPSLTNGCDGFTCGVYTPFGLSTTASNQVLGAVFLNISGAGAGVVITANTIATDTVLTSFVLADWELSTPTAIPLPASGWLFLSGLVGLFIVKRRKTLIAA